MVKNFIAMAKKFKQENKMNQEIKALIIKHATHKLTVYSLLPSGIPEIEEAADECKQILDYFRKEDTLIEKKVELTFQEKYENSFLSQDNNLMFTREDHLKKMKKGLGNLTFGTPEEILNPIKPEVANIYGSWTFLTKEVSLNLTKVGGLCLAIIDKNIEEVRVKESATVKEIIFTKTQIIKLIGIVDNILTVLKKTESLTDKSEIEKYEYMLKCLIQRNKKYAGIIIKVVGVNDV